MYKLYTFKQSQMTNKQQQGNNKMKLQREYYIDPLKDNTTRYVIKDGYAYYVGKIGVKSDNLFLKFTWYSAGKINLNELKKLSNQKALEKEMKKDPYMPQIDFKKLYKR